MSELVLVLHDALKPLSWLQGRWTTTRGLGKYPTISDFKYHEDLEFCCVGQPMFNYSSTSYHPEKGTQMHQERGFLRIKPGTNELAFIISHNFGLASVEEGCCNPETKLIKLQTGAISRMPFAKPPHVKKITRELRLLSDGMLEVVICMETTNTPLAEHLRAVYQKVS